MNKDSDEDNVVSFSEFKAKAIDESNKSDFAEESFLEEEIPELNFDLEDLFPSLGDIIPVLLEEQLHQTDNPDYLKEICFEGAEDFEGDEETFFDRPEKIEPHDIDVFEPLLNCLSSLYAEMLSTEMSIKDDQVWAGLSNIGQEISALEKFCIKRRKE